MCSLGSQQFVCMNEIETGIPETADCSVCDTCHFSSTTDGQTASLPTLSFSSKPDRGRVGFNTELPSLWATKVYDLNGSSLWKQTPKHQHIVGKGIQPLGVTGSQDLSSKLRLLQVPNHLGKNWQVPSLWPACPSKSVGGWLK